MPVPAYNLLVVLAWPGVCSQCWLECFIRGCWEGVPFLFLYASCLHICVENSCQVCADGVESVLCRSLILFRKSTLCVDGSECELCVSTVRSRLSVCWQYQVCYVYVYVSTQEIQLERVLMWAGCVRVSQQGSTWGGCWWCWWYWSSGWTSLLPRLLQVRLQFPFYDFFFSLLINIWSRSRDLLNRQRCRE